MEKTSNPSVAASPADVKPEKEGYEFRGGYPTEATAQKAYDDADLNRAIQAYRFFFPTVSSAAIFNESIRLGIVPNKIFGYLDTQPKHVGFTLNSDTPYGEILLNLEAGPLVIELPEGPLLGAALDIHQGWIMDMGIPGPDKGKGGRHLILPPGYKGEVPSGYYVGYARSYRIIVGLRSLPQNGNVAVAIARFKTVMVRPLEPSPAWTEPSWIDMTPLPQDQTPFSFESKLGYWKALHKILETEPPLADARILYGELAALGITREQPFQPDARRTAILEEAARRGAAQMRAEAFADRRPDRVVWKDRQWQWASLRPENGSFDTPDYRDNVAADKWFYQAIAASPAMFSRDPGAGSLYWLGLRTAMGEYLYGSKSYRLRIPLPVPASLFWSVTVYDAETRSQVQTDQGKAALRSLFELKDLPPGDAVDLFFGPAVAEGNESRWIKTIAGKGWFVYLRIYGPGQAAFDGTWKPGDFEEVK